MSDETNRDEILERCLTRLQQGETIDQVLASYPDKGATLRPALEAAASLRHAPAPRPSGAAQQLAMARMMSQVAAERARPEPAGVLAWMGTLRARPLAFQAAALAGGLMLFAGLGIGASAATGTTPSPVRTFFGLSQESLRPVQLSGSVVSIKESTLVIDTPSGPRTVTLGSATVLRRGDVRVAWSDLVVGEQVNVTASERAGQLTATLVSASVAPAAPAGGPPPHADGAASPGIDDGGLNVETPAPHGDGTAEGDDPVDQGDGDNDSHQGGGQATSTATPGGHDGEGEGGDDAEEQHSTSTAPPGTKTPEPGDDEYQPGSTQTPEDETDAENGTPEPHETEAPNDDGTEGH